MIFNWRTEMWRSNGREIPVRDMDERHLTLKLLKQRQKHAVKHAQGSRTWRERMKLGIQAVTVELDTRICQIHRSEPGESPTDCDVEEIARACATLRLKQFLARTRRDKKKEK